MQKCNAHFFSIISVGAFINFCFQKVDYVYSWSCSLAVYEFVTFTDFQSAHNSVIWKKSPACLGYNAKVCHYDETLFLLVSPKQKLCCLLLPKWTSPVTQENAERTCNSIVLNSPRPSVCHRILSAK